MTSPNINCLEGMRCPSCKSYGPFLFTVSATCLVSDDGTDDFYDVEWDDHAWAGCKQCEYQGTVSDFYEEE